VGSDRARPQGWTLRRTQDLLSTRVGTSYTQIALQYCPWCTITVRPISYLSDIGHNPSPVPHLIIPTPLAGSNLPDSETLPIFHSLSLSLSLSATSSRAVTICFTTLRTLPPPFVLGYLTSPGSLNVNEEHWNI